MGRELMAVEEVMKAHHPIVVTHFRVRTGFSPTVLSNDHVMILGVRQHGKGKLRPLSHGEL